MEKKIYFITGKDGFFGQYRKPWTSLKSDVMVDALRNAGWKVVVCQFHEIANGKIVINNSLVFYTFSQKKEIREYIKNITLYLKMQNNHLIPSYELLKCHEDKGFQELLRKQLNVAPLTAYYISDVSEIDNYNIEYPCVLKTVDGSNGRGVFLINSRSELIKKIDELLPELDVLTRLDFLRREYFRKNKEVKNWPEFDPKTDLDCYREYLRPTRNLVIQKFIPDLEFDFRVLAVYDHFYVTKRYVKKGDFRASGTKLFDFDTGNVEQILSFAEDIHEKFKHPYLSMDITVSGEELNLLEYQTLHFGNNVIRLSEGYYTKKDCKWQFVSQKPDVNQVLADGLVRYLEMTYSQLSDSIR